MEMERYRASEIAIDLRPVPESNARMRTGDGKEVDDALGELELCAEIFDYYATEGAHL